MADAEHAVREAAKDIPTDVCLRLDSASNLSDEDRDAILQLARQSLARFQPKQATEDSS